MLHSEHAILRAAHETQATIEIRFERPRCTTLTAPDDVVVQHLFPNEVLELTPRFQPEMKDAFGLYFGLPSEQRFAHWSNECRADATNATSSNALTRIVVSTGMRAGIAPAPFRTSIVRSAPEAWA